MDIVSGAGAMSEPILSVEKLKKYFPIVQGMLLARPVVWLKAVDDVDFTIQRAETFALVGESGSGKTTTAFCILNLLTPTSGAVRIDGVDIANATRTERATYRRSIQAVFQDPYSSLSPRLRVRSIISEPLVVNARMTKRERKERVDELIAQVGLPAESSELYPHEFSGGQRQRIALARALAVKPKLVVIDEPVSGLDVSIRAQVMNLLKDLQESLGVAYLLIAHDLANVRYMSTSVAVMYMGKIVERAPTEELFERPKHPYTQALLSAALPSHPDARRREITLTGEASSTVEAPRGCRFHSRCFRATQICSEQEPSLEAVGSQCFVACHLYR
jgi:oligopeptide/dipeptide ABC transporter ATP-binding protein